MWHFSIFSVAYKNTSRKLSNDFVNAAEDRLLPSVIIHNPYHILHPLFPYSHQTVWPPQASPSIYPTLKRWQAMYSPCPITASFKPCFLLSSPRFDFPLPVDAPLILIFFSQCNLSLSLHLLLLAPINSCSFYYFIVYFVFIHSFWPFLLHPFKSSTTQRCSRLQHG